LLQYVHPDLAALLGAACIWLAVMVVGVISLYVDSGISDRTYSDPEALRDYVYSRYQPLLAVQFLASSFWIGLAASNWWIVWGLFLVFLLGMLWLAAGRETPRSPIWLFGSVFMMLLAVVFGTLLRIALTSST
jgi:hypothetical protein